MFPSEVSSAFFLSFLCWFFLLYCISQYQISSRFWPSSWKISSFLKALNCIEMLEIPSVFLRPSHPFWVPVACLTSAPECFMHISHLMCFPSHLMVPSFTQRSKSELWRSFLLLSVHSWYILFLPIPLFLKYTFIPPTSPSPGAPPYSKPLSSLTWTLERSRVYLLSLTFRSPMSFFSLNHFTVFSFIG